MMSTSRQRAPFSRYSPSPSRDRLRTIDISEKSLGRARGRIVVDHDLHLGGAKPLMPWPPAKITSFIVWPRTASGPARRGPRARRRDVRLPGAVGADDHRHARRELELGPPGEGLSFDGYRAQVHQSSGSRPSRAWRAASCSALFFVFLPAAHLLPADLGHGDETAVVRRALLGGDPIGHHSRPARQPLLEHRLVVDGMLQGVVDLLGERDDHRRGCALDAEAEVAAPISAPHRRQHPLRLHEHSPRCGRWPPARPRAAARARRGPAPPAHRTPADGLRADLGQAAGAVTLEAREEVIGHGEAQHDVTQERQTLVGLGAVLDPRRVRVGLPPQVVRQLLDKLPEPSGRLISAAWPATKSAACPTVRILAASSSGMRIP